MFAGAPDAVDMMGATLTSSGTLITIPAGKWFTGDLVLSATVTVAGSSIPTVSTGGSTPAPAAGTVISRLNVTGLALTTVCDSVSHEVLVYGGESGATIQFTAGANGTSSASLHGYIFG